MMWVYGIKARKLRALDLHSLEELKLLTKRFEWFWIDCMDLSPNEFKIFSELIYNEPKILEDIKSGKTFPRYKKYDDCTILSISVAVVQDELKTYPIYIAFKEKMLLTLRKKESSSPIEYAIQTLQDCLSEEIGPSFVLCEVLRETTNRNLDVVMRLREMIEKVEEEAIAEPSKKAIANEVFALKRQIAKLYRLLWSEQQMIGNIKDGLIPNIKLCQNPFWV